MEQGKDDKGDGKKLLSEVQNGIHSMIWFGKEWFVSYEYLIFFLNTEKARDFTSLYLCMQKLSTTQLSRN